MASSNEFLSADGNLPAEMTTDNTGYRADFLKIHRLLTAAELNELSGYAADSKSRVDSRWTAEGKVFAITHGGERLFPAFQFSPEDGRPLPVIEKVLSKLPMAMSPWGRAFWFVAPNGWLGGSRPIDMLHDDGPLVRAAGMAAEPDIG